MECDSWAVNYRLSLSPAECLSPPNPRFFLEPAALFVGGVKQAQLDPALLQEHVVLLALRQRWLERSTISPEAEAAIDWPSLGQAMRNLPPKLQRWTTKHSVGMCGVGKFLKIWGDENHSGCPLCAVSMKTIYMSLGALTLRRGGTGIIAFTISPLGWILNRQPRQTNKLFSRL